MKSQKELDFYTINKFQPKVPEEFLENYWRIYGLRDRLVELHKTLFELKSQMKIKLNFEGELPQDKDLIDFALDNDDEKAQWFVFVSLFDRLLNDFCHYTYFGLIAINPAHITPAYTLLRKPYTQTLPILEWAIDDADDFLKKFIKKVGDIDSHLKKRNKNKRDKIRKKVSKRLHFPFNDLLKDFADLSHFDSSAHLVTTRTAKTENLNMNFIFLNEDKELAEQHTSSLIYMNALYLAYAYVIFLTIFKSIEVEQFTQPKKLKELIDSVDYSYTLFHSYALMLTVMINDAKENKSSLDLFNLYAKILDIKCSNCKKCAKISHPIDLQVFADYETLYCDNCKHLIIQNESVALSS